MEIQTVTIKNISQTNELIEGDRLPVGKEEGTRSVSLGVVKDFIINELESDLGTETQARIQGDSDTLQSANEYTDQRIADEKLATNEWLSPVKTTALLPTSGLSNDRNYLCKVVNDPVQNGVYQAVAGWEDQPEWELYDENIDFVIEEELTEAVESHDQDESAHEYIQNNIEAIRDNLQHQIDVLDPSGLVAELGGKAEKDHAGQDTEQAPYPNGKANGGIYGHVQFPTAETASFTAVLPYHFIAEATEFNLPNIREPGRHILANPLPTSIGFPADFGTIDGAVLDVISFGSGELKHVLHKKGSTAKWECYTRPNNAWSDWYTKYPVGHIVVQYPDEDSPGDKNFPGNWKIINDDAVLYGLSRQMPTATEYAAGQNVAIDTYKIYTEDHGDRRIYRAKEDLANVPAELDPVKWERLQDNLNPQYAPHFVGRSEIQPDLEAAPMAIGTVIEGGEFDGMVVTEIITCAGYYFAVAGGNRPTYVSGGVHGDMMRPIDGTFRAIGNPWMNNYPPTRVFHEIGTPSIQCSSSGDSFINAEIRFDSSRVVPTGKEFETMNLGVVLWRKTSNP